MVLVGSDVPEGTLPGLGEQKRPSHEHHRQKLDWLAEDRRPVSRCARCQFGAQRVMFMNMDLLCFMFVNITPQVWSTSRCSSHF